MNQEDIADKYISRNKESYKRDSSKWKNKNEWAVVGAVRDRLQEFYNARSTSCYLTSFTGSKSWDVNWDLVEKDYLQYVGAVDPDDFKSNLKSPMAYRTISAIDARYRRQDLEFLIDARNEEDKDKATIFKYIYKDYFRRHPDIRYELLDVFKMTDVLGTGIAYIPYTRKTRTVKMPNRTEGSKVGDIENIKYEKKEIVDFDDPDFMYVNLKDFYVDPNCRNLHGRNYAATDCAWVTYPTIDQFMDEFEGDPEVFNLDKVTADNKQELATSFFKLPRDVVKGTIELIRYYNVSTDSFIVIANDVLIRNTPLPYQDKMLPFVRFVCVEHPGHFYGRGIPDIMLQLSSEDAAIRNLQLDRVKMTIDAPILAGATVFGDLEEQYQRIEPGQIIKVGDINQIKTMDSSTMPFDSFRLRSELKDEAVMSTGVNPQGMTLPMASTPATNTLTMKETMQDMINLYSDNKMRGLNWYGILLFSRFCEFYSRPSKQESLKLNKKAYRKIRLEDMELLTDKSGNLQQHKIKGYKTFELKPEYFKWTADPTIYISADFIAPISKAWQMRKAQEMLPQLAPFAGDPDTPLKNGGKPIINIRTLLREYVDVMEWGDKDLLIDEDEDRIDEITQAQQQQKDMQDNKFVAGHPGEPTAHRYTHAVELLALNNAVSSQDFIMMPPQISQLMLKYRDTLVKHLEEDSLLTSNADIAALQQAQPPVQPEVPMNNAVSVPTVSGNMGLPNSGGIPVPSKMGPEDVMGQMAGQAS